MKRPSCLLVVGLAGLLAVTACAPAATSFASAPGRAPRMLLAEATPAPAGTDAPAAASAAPSTPAAPPPSAAPASASSSSDPPETTEERHARLDRRTWGWALGSVGAASAVIALGTSIVMLKDNGDRNANCNAAHVCNANGITANQAINDLGGWNLAAYIVAGVGLGAGAYLLLTNPADKRRTTEVGVAPNGSGGSLLLQGSF